MTSSSLERDVDLVCDLVKSKRRDGGRTIVGVAGPPASGKSTLAESLVEKLNREGSDQVPEAALLPMDGYHLDNRILESRGLLARKGSPETFNAHGFCDAVKRLTTTKRETLHPRFDRQMDLSIAQSIVIHPDTPFVVVEGNYLLLKRAPWAALKDVFDVTVFVCPTRDALLERLKQRWINHGLDAEAALLRAQGNDLPNADLVMHESHAADLHLTQNYKEFGVRYAF